VASWSFGDWRDRISVPTAALDDDREKLSRALDRASRQDDNLGGLRPRVILRASPKRFCNQGNKPSIIARF